MRSIITSHYKQAMLLVLLCIAGACKDSKGVDPTPQERVRKLMIANPWQLASVTVEGIDAAELFPGFTLTFTESNFTSTNGGPVWPASGAWSFANAEATKFTRADGKEVTITSIDANTFVLTLQQEETVFEGGRSKALAGQHIFTLKK